MAHIEPALPFDHFSGKLSRKERIVMRTRNGRTHAYAIMHPYTGPLAESRKRAISTSANASLRCPIPNASRTGKTVTSSTAVLPISMSPAPMRSSSD